MKKIRGKSVDLYCGCRSHVTSSVGHAVSPRGDQLHLGVKGWGSLLAVPVCITVMESRDNTVMTSGDGHIL